MIEPSAKEDTRDCIFFVLALHKHYSDVLEANDLVKILAERYRLVILTEHYGPEEAKKRKLFEHQLVSYRRLIPRHRKFFWISDRYLRTYFIRELDYLLGVRIYDYRRYVHHIGHRILSNLGGFLPKRLITAEGCTRFEGFVVRPSREFRELVRRYRPRLIITATCGSTPLEAEAILAARELGIPTLAVDLNLDYPHYQSKKARRTDYVTVWNPTMAGEVMEYTHFPPDHVRVTGSLRYDHYFADAKRGLVRSRKEFLRSKGLDPSKQTIVWTATTGFFKHVRKLMENLLEARAAGRLGNGPNILVRPHPGGVWEKYRRFEGIPGLAIDYPTRNPLYDEVRKDFVADMDEKDLINLTQTLMYADVVICVSSTMLVEAALFDKPVVSIGFPESMLDAYRSEPMRYFIERGVTPIARTVEELIEHTRRYLDHPELQREERKQFAQDYIYFTDGANARRTAEFIDEIVRGQNPANARSGSRREPH